MVTAPTTEDTYLVVVILWVIWKARNGAQLDDNMQLLHVSMNEINTLHIQLMKYYQHHRHESRHKYLNGN